MKKLKTLALFIGVFFLCTFFINTNVLVFAVDSENGEQQKGINEQSKADESVNTEIQENPTFVSRLGEAWKKNEAKIYSVISWIFSGANLTLIANFLLKFKKRNSSSDAKSDKAYKNLKNSTNSIEKSANKLNNATQSLEQIDENLNLLNERIDELEKNQCYDNVRNEKAQIAILQILNTVYQKSGLAEPIKNQISMLFNEGMFFDKEALKRNAKLGKLKEVIDNVVEAVNDITPKENEKNNEKNMAIEEKEKQNEIVSKKISSTQIQEKQETSENISENTVELF